jgi:ankyrin repeat protein
LHKKAAKLIKEKNVDLNEVSANGMTALAFAAYHGHQECVRLLIKNGADVERREGYGLTPLMTACQAGHHIIARILIEDGKAEVNTADAEMCTALGHACRFGRTECVQLLLEKKADVEVPDRNGATPLMAACKNGYAEAAGLLIEAGADVDKEDFAGNTALWLAAHNGHVACAKLLIDEGADVFHMNRSEVGILQAAKLGEAQLNEESDNHRLVAQMLVEASKSGGTGTEKFKSRRTDLWSYRIDPNPPPREN